MSKKVGKILALEFQKIAEKNATKFLGGYVFAAPCINKKTNSKPNRAV